ncbi:MAG: hypothetical protein WC705_03495 [Candidatus Paceibacterota bacterium]
MKKSISTRIKITKNGKTVRRQIAQCHFRAKRTGKQTRQKSNPRSADSIARRIFKKPGTL